MERIIGIALLILALVACVAGLVVLSLSASAVSDSMAAGQQAVTDQYDAMSGVVAGTLGLVAGAMFAVIGILLAWVLGLLGYVIYPAASEDSPGLRKVLDVIALIGGGLLALLMAASFILATINVLGPPADVGLQLGGAGYLVALLITVALLALGATGVKRGWQNLRS